MTKQNHSKRDSSERFKLNIWDVGGQKSLRSYWRNYFESTDGLVWVVDSADRLRLEDCRKELSTLLLEESTQSEDHRHHRKEKNRDAARKSRKKHTEKADLLHEELQTLEQSNAAFVKEIAELKKEFQLYTTALEQHIPHCTKLCPFEPSVNVTGGPSTATPSTSDITFSTDPNFLPDLAFLPECNSVDISLTDLLDISDWCPWDSVNGNGCLQQF